MLVTDKFRRGRNTKVKPYTRARTEQYKQDQTGKKFGKISLRVRRETSTVCRHCTLQQGSAIYVMGVITDT